MLIASAVFLREAARPERRIDLGEGRAPLRNVPLKLLQKQLLVLRWTSLSILQPITPMASRSHPDDHAILDDGFEDLALTDRAPIYRTSPGHCLWE